MSKMRQEEPKEKKVCVAIRIRPRLEARGERYETGIVNKADPTHLSCVNPRQAAREQYHFAFDHVFDGSDSQEEVYETAAADMAINALDGCAEGRRVGNVILTYGQTGSGKTYTLLGRGLGPRDELLPESGIFLRVLSDLLRFKTRCRDQHLIIRLSIIEVYNEQLRDLLNDRQTLHYSERGEDIVPRNPQTWTINSIGQVKRAFALAHANRAVASTQMNDESSRSHALFIVDLFQQVKCKETPVEHLEELVQSGHWDAAARPSHASLPFMTTRYQPRGPQGIRASRLSSGAGVLHTPRSGERGGARVRSSSLTLARSQSVPPFHEAGDDGPLSPSALQAKQDIQQQYPITMSNLTMVDLAGSERTKRSHAAGAVFREAVAVNTSLSVLGKVVNDIVHRASHIPFRESMLTRLLRSSFMSERSKILLIANVAPTENSFHETRDTLKFADRLQMLRPSEGSLTSAFRAGDSEREAEYRLCLRHCEELGAELRIAAQQFSFSLRQATQRRAHWPPLSKRAADSLRPEVTQRYRTTVGARDEAERRRNAEMQERLLQEYIDRFRREREASDPQIALEREQAKTLLVSLEDEGRIAHSLQKEIDERQSAVDEARAQAAAPHENFELFSSKRREVSDRLIALVAEERRVQASIDRLKAAIRDQIQPELDECRQRTKSVDRDLEQGVVREGAALERLLKEGGKRLELVRLRRGNAELAADVAALRAELEGDGAAAAAEAASPGARLPDFSAETQPHVSPLALHFNPTLKPPPPPPIDCHSDVCSEDDEGRSPPAALASAAAAPRRGQPGAGRQTGSRRGQARPASRDDDSSRTLATQRARLAKVFDGIASKGVLTNEDGLAVFSVLSQIRCSQHAVDAAASAAASLDEDLQVTADDLRRDCQQKEVGYTLRALALYPDAPQLLRWLSPGHRPSILDFVGGLFAMWREGQSRFAESKHG